MKCEVLYKKNLAGFLHFKELSNFENISNRNTLLIERAHLNIYKIIVYTAIITKFKDVRAHRVVGPRESYSRCKSCERESPESISLPFCHRVCYYLYWSYSSKLVLVEGCTNCIGAVAAVVTKLFTFANRLSHV